MDKKIDLFFNAVKNNNFRYVSSEWLSIFAEIFPKSLFDQEGFQILKQFYHHIETFIRSNHYRSVRDFLESDHYPVYLDAIQQTAAEKIYELLPGVIHSLNPTFNSGATVTDQRTLKSRLTDKKVQELKFWMDHFREPGQLYQRLRMKSSFSAEEYDLIVRLELREKYNILLKSVYSRKKSLKNRLSALRALFMTDDETLEEQIKSITLSPDIHEEIRMEAIRYSIIHHDGDPDYWHYLSSNSMHLTAVVPLLQYKIMSLTGDSPALYQILKNSDHDLITEQILIILIARSQAKIPTMKGVFSRILFARGKKNIREKTRQELISETIKEVFLRYFNESPLKVRSFGSAFQNLFRKFETSTPESFLNFSELLTGILRKEELEFIINEYLTQSVAINRRESVAEKLKTYFQPYRCVYNRQNGKLMLTGKTGSL